MEFPAIWLKMTGLCAMQQNFRYRDGLDMSELKPLDYYGDYFKDAPPIYEIQVESQSLLYPVEHIRRIGWLARTMMMRHEKIMLTGLEHFAEGRLSLAAREMEAAGRAMPWLPDLRVIAALSHFLSGRPGRALEAILPSFDVQGGLPMGRFLKAWMPSLRILVRLDYDLVMAFYPNRLGMMMAAVAAHRETGDLVAAGKLVERAASEYYLIDEMLYTAVLIHMQLGNYGDGWRLLSNRTYKNTDSLDIGLTMLRGEAMLSEFGLERGISEFRAALLFTHNRNPHLVARAQYRLAMMYKEGGYELDEAELLRKINRDFVPKHLQKKLSERIANLPDPAKLDDDEDGGREPRLDPNYHRRFDYVWRGRKDKNEQTDFLEV